MICGVNHVRMLGMCVANHMCMLGMCGDNRVCNLGCVVLTRCAGNGGERSCGPFQGHIGLSVIGGLEWTLTFFFFFFFSPRGNYIH